MSHRLKTGIEICRKQALRNQMWAKPSSRAEQAQEDVNTTVQRQDKQSDSEQVPLGRRFCFGGRASLIDLIVFCLLTPGGLNCRLVPGQPDGGVRALAHPSLKNSILSAFPFPHLVPL